MCVFMFLQPNSQSKPSKQKETGLLDKKLVYGAALPPARIESGPTLKGAFTGTQNLFARINRQQYTSV